MRQGGRLRAQELSKTRLWPGRWGWWRLLLLSLLEISHDLRQVLKQLGVHSHELHRVQRHIVVLRLAIISTGALLITLTAMVASVPSVGGHLLIKNHNERIRKEVHTDKI